MSISQGAHTFRFPIKEVLRGRIVLSLGEPGLEQKRYKKGELQQEHAPALISRLKKTAVVLLDLNGCARFFKLRFSLLRFFFRNPFFNGSRHTFD